MHSRKNSAEKNGHGRKKNNMKKTIQEKTKKALTIASKILKSVDELKQTTLDIIIK